MTGFNFWKPDFQGLVLNLRNASEQRKYREVVTLIIVNRIIFN